MFTRYKRVKKKTEKAHPIYNLIFWPRFASAKGRHPPVVSLVNNGALFLLLYVISWIGDSALIIDRYELARGLVKKATLLGASFPRGSGSWFTQISPEMLAQVSVPAFSSAHPRIFHTTIKLDSVFLWRISWLSANAIQYTIRLAGRPHAAAQDQILSAGTKHQRITFRNVLHICLDTRLSLLFWR